jgi:hypothetical protein
MKAKLLVKLIGGIALALILMSCGSSNDSTSQLNPANDTRVLKFSPGLEYNAHRDVIDSIIETELIQYTLEQRSTLSDWWDSITGAAGRAELSSDEQNEVSYFLIEKFFNRYNNDFGKYYGIYGDELSTHINSLGHDSIASQSVEAFTSSLREAYAVSATKSALSQSVTDDFSEFLTTFLETDGFEEHVIYAASMLYGRVNSIYLNTITSDPDSTLTRQEALDAFNAQFLQNDSEALETLAVAEAQSILTAASVSNGVTLLEWQNEILNGKFANLTNLENGSAIPEACLVGDKIVMSQSLAYDQYGSTAAGQLGDGTLAFFPSAQNGAITVKGFPQSGAPTSSYVPGFATAYLDADTWGEFIWVGDGEIYLYDDQNSGFTQITSADLDISKLPSVGFITKHAKIVYTVQGAMLDYTGTVHIIITASYFEDTISDNSGVEPLLIYYTYDPSDKKNALVHQKTVQTTGFATSGCNTFLAAQGKNDIYIKAETDGVNPKIMMGAGSTCASKKDSSTTFLLGSVSDLQSLDNYTDLSKLSPDTLPSGTLRQTNTSLEPSCTYYAPIASSAKDKSANFYHNTQFNNNGFNDAYAGPSSLQWGHSYPDIAAIITSPACDNGKNCKLAIDFSNSDTTAETEKFVIGHTFSDTFAVTVDGDGAGFKDSMKSFSSTAKTATSSQSYGMGENKTTYCNSSTCSETALEPVVLYHTIPFAFIEVNGIKSGGTIYSTGENVVQLVNLGGTPGFLPESISSFDSTGSLQTALFGSFDFKTATAHSYLSAKWYSTKIGSYKYQCISPQDLSGSSSNCFVSQSQNTSQTTTQSNSNSISADIITGFKSSFLGFFSMSLKDTISFGTTTTSENAFTESFGSSFKVTFTYSDTGMETANGGNVFPHVGYYFANRTVNASYGTYYNDYFTVATSWLEDIN